MFLRELHVEGHPTVGAASLVLDPTTAWIGENDCGAGSLLGALELALASDDARLTRGRDRRALAAGARTVLVFEERERGDWSSAVHAPLRPLLRSARGERRQVVLETVVRPASGRGAPEIATHVHDASDAAASRAIAAHVRATSPVIRLTGGVMTAAPWIGGRATTARFEAKVIAPELAELAEKVLDRADELLSGRADDPQRCIDEGADFARQLLARSQRHVRSNGSALAASVLELLGERESPAANDGADNAPDDGPLSERLGVLLVVSAVLRSLPGVLAPGVEPIWVIEDPEAHLHPMTLTSVARLLERIRWQKIVTTQSGDLLSALPLANVRRLVRHGQAVHVRAVRRDALSREDLRRLGYHLRSHRGVAMFGRVWLLVEGESEFWILPQVARVLGRDFALEGVCCVSFAQSGLDALIKAAREFGIEWHLLSDGDEAGRRYADQASAFLSRGEERERITLLRERDIEHCFWQHGHSAAILRTAGLQGGPAVSASRAIGKALQRRSKPYLALQLVESVARRGPRSVPAPLAQLVETCVALARNAPMRLADSDLRPRRRSRANEPVQRRRPEPKPLR